LGMCLGLGAIQAQAQSLTYNFTDGTSDGWANAGFSGSPVASVSNIGGLNYVYLPFVGFQSGNDASDSAGNLAGFNAAMSAAISNPSGYNISYNYYLNTATISGATFLQLGVFVNTGSGYYKQDYSTPNQVQFNGTQLTSGQVFTGTVTENLNTITGGVSDTSAETYFRLGLIENTTTGATGGVYFTDISVTPVPEPATMSLCGLGLAGLMFLRRRKA
jgi:PEP-CTERM motif